MPTESNMCFGLVISAVEKGVSPWGELEGTEWLEFFLSTVKIYLACDLMLKKKLLPLMIELVVI